MLNSLPSARSFANTLLANCYRRLVGKTQLFPGLENDYFRNRLTHSNEVERISCTIAKKINHEHEYFSYHDKDKGKENCINLNILRFAADAHDLGHPPFGHIGERTLDSLLLSLNSNSKKYLGYGLRFEGNAQTIRLLTRIEKKFIPSKSKVGVEAPDFIDREGIIKIEKDGVVKRVDKRIGLNPTFRNLASIMKYDNKITDTDEVGKVSKGYYMSEADLIQKMKEAVIGTKNLEKWQNKFKTIECSIMDLADDIAYTTFDIEDALKGRFISMLDFFNTFNQDIFVEVIEEYNKVIIKANSEDIYDPPLDIINLPAIKDKDALGKAMQEFVAIIGKPFFDLGFVEESKTLPTDGEFDAPHFKVNQMKVAEIATHVFNVSNRVASNGFWRTFFTSSLVDYFIDSVEVKFIEECPSMSRAYLKPEQFKVMEALKKFVFIFLTKSPRLTMVDYRGGEIVKEIFNELMFKPELLPSDYKKIYDRVIPEMGPRVICDFVSGMTDLYAVEFYSRLKSENHKTIFKPF
jgi:dGTPase